MKFGALQDKNAKNQLQIQLVELGLPINDATKIAKEVFSYLTTLPQPEAWQKIAKKILTHQTCFGVHKLLYEVVYPDYTKIPSSAWFPKKSFIKKTHIAKLMRKLKFSQYADFQTWSSTHYADFCDILVKKLHIIFDKPYKKTVDITEGVEMP